MQQPALDLIIDIINQAHDLTLATIRPDGYPQATTVSYANDGLTIYVGVGKDSQKVHNIRHCDKVSLTINLPYTDWMHIRGLSAAALADILQDQSDIEHAMNCLSVRFPQIKQGATSDFADEIIFLRIRPQIVSLLDYEKGFGHTELVKI
jgi:general stress protein 26